MPTDNGYRKDNYCPYCNYFCDAASTTEDPKAVPKPGDLSFCLMCCNPGQFGDDMKLIKFDINSVANTAEKERLFNLQAKMTLFWSLGTAKKDDLQRREKYLKNLK